MRKMKDSRVDWIGEIPDCWKIVKGKWILKKIVRPILDNDSIITCFRDGEVTLRSNRREEGFTIALNESGYQGIEPGDLVVHGMDGFAGAIGISDSRGKSSPVLNVLDSDQNKNYLKYYLRCMAYMGIFEALSTGIRIRTCDTNWNKLKELYYIEPDYEEQKKIANYLDEKINIIDNTLLTIKETIDEYKKLKSRIIVEAITKGINKNVKTKNSGIEWIGNIPDNWSIQKLKYILSSEKNNLKVGPFGSALTSSDFKSEGIWVYNQRSILDNNFKTNDTFINQIKYKELEGFKIMPDDILITTRGSIGKIAIVPPNAPRGVIHPCIIRFRIDKTKMSHEILKYIFNESDFVLNQIKIKSNSTTMDVLYSQTLKEIYLPIIPEEESKQILNFLDNKCNKINKIIQLKEKIYKELELYKKSLIYEYVTGKREVLNNKNTEMAELSLRIIEQLPNNYSMCKIKLNKIQSVILKMIKYKREPDYEKYAAGPYSEKMMNDVYEIFKEKRWVKISKNNIRDVYTLDDNYMEGIEEYNKHFKKYDNEITRIIKLFKNKDTQQSEIIATLFYCWNDFLIDGATPTEDQLVEEFYAWSKRKTKININKVKSCLSYMKKNNLIPSGYGKKTIQRSNDYGRK